jgi:uncharacterized protein (TIGR03067 family)
MQSVVVAFNAFSLAGDSALVGCGPVHCDAKSEMTALIGTWQLVSAETDGVNAPAERVSKTRIVISDSRHSVYFGNEEVVHGVPFAIEPTANPKAAVDTLPDGPNKGKRIKSIHKIECDNLTSCVAKIGELPPEKFASKSGMGHTLRVFKRVAKVIGTKS